MNNKNTVFRVLDANLNRAVEGIRVLEETARMFLDDSKLTVRLKEIRHSITGIIKNQKNLDFNLLSERGSDHDLFRSVELITEGKRSDLLSIIRANSSRAREALRSLEEYIKLVYPSMSVEFKKIRFDLYDLEKDLSFRVHKRYFFNDGHLKLGVILDRDRIIGDICSVSSVAIENGADIIVYSSEKLSDKIFMEDALKLESLCEGKAMFMIKSRLDAAILSGADGICLAPGDADLWMCRKIVGEGFYLAGMIELQELKSKEISDYPDMIILKTDNTIPKVDEAYKLLEAPYTPFLYYCRRKPNNIADIVLHGSSGLIIEPDFSDTEETFKMINMIREELENV
jgi:thiamine-phosphate pyrophosphorylase